MSHFYYVVYFIKHSFYLLPDYYLQKPYRVTSSLLLRYIMPHGKIFMLKKLSEAFTVKYFVKYIFWVTWLKFFINITERITSVKLQIADGLLEVGLRLIYFSKTLTANQQPILWNTYFSVSFLKSSIFFLFFDRSIFDEIMFIYELKSEKNYYSIERQISYEEG